MFGREAVDLLLLAARGGRGGALVLRGEPGIGTTSLLARADVAPTMEWLVENLLVHELKARLADVLLADPILYTLGEIAVRRYRRRVLVN
jgi:hypothetical protein